MSDRIGTRSVPPRVKLHLAGGGEVRGRDAVAARRSLTPNALSEHVPVRLSLLTSTFIVPKLPEGHNHSTSPGRVRRASGRDRDGFSAAVWPGAAALADWGPVVAVSLEEGGAREIPGPRPRGSHSLSRTYIGYKPCHTEIGAAWLRQWSGAAHTPGIHPPRPGRRPSACRLPGARARWVQSGRWYRR